MASISAVAITISIINPLLNMSPMYRILQLKCHENNPLMNGIMFVLLKYGGLSGVLDLAEYKTGIALL